MVGYGEIRYKDEASFYGWIKGVDPSWSTLYRTFDALKHQRFITSVITKKEQVFDTLKKFLSAELSKTQT